MTIAVSLPKYRSLYFDAMVAEDAGATVRIWNGKLLATPRTIAENR
jgi:hypothetical protein